MGRRLGSIPIPLFSPTRIYKAYQHKLISYVTEGREEMECCGT